MKSSKVYQVMNSLTSNLLKKYADVEVKGKENLENIEGGIVVANHAHASLRSKDHFLITYAFGKNIPLHFFVYSGIYEDPLMRFVLNRTKQIPVNPGKRDSVNRDCFKLAQKYLSRSDCVALFPEGRTDTLAARKNNGKRYYPGLTKVLAETDKPIIPVRLDIHKNGVEHFFKPNFDKASVVIGEPYYFHEDRGNDKYDLNTLRRKEMVDITKMIMEEKVYSLESLI
ncbi:1-acyl-sn-glycerol-3-phosphate acyltransferase [archaeon]|jgi:1-acyl-sn-glycerol-3-phosphate acyltransferase|nr:1-acyl-sn-glycerol-3-phosphate acyltransferase [archaeon]